MDQILYELGMEQQQQQQEEDDHESDEDYQPTPTPTEMMLAKLLAKMELMETENATLKASLVAPSAYVAPSPPPPPVVVEDPEMVALQLKNKEMMNMLAAAKAKSLESPAKKALRLENEALQRQVAMLMNGGGGGGVPMVVGNNDDEDSVGSDLSGSSVGSVVSTSRVIFTGEIAFVARKGWFRVCRLSEYGQTLYTLRDDNTVKSLSVPQSRTIKPNSGECPNR